MSGHDAIDAYILFTDKNHDRLSGFRRAQFRHVVLLENDDRHPDRWLLRQWRNGREMVRSVQESDFSDAKREELRMIDAVKRGMLDVDMNGEVDLDVRIVEVVIPQVRPRRMFKIFRANDLGYVKWRLGMGWSHWWVRSPFKLYKMFEEHGPNAVEKTTWHFSFWRMIGAGWSLARKAG